MALSCNAEVLHDYVQHGSLFNVKTNSMIALSCQRDNYPE